MPISLSSHKLPTAVKANQKILQTKITFLSVRRSDSMHPLKCHLSLYVNVLLMNIFSTRTNTFFKQGVLRLLNSDEPPVQYICSRLTTMQQYKLDGIRKELTVYLVQVQKHTHEQELKVCRQRGQLHDNEPDYLQCCN